MSNIFLKGRRGKSKTERKEEKKKKTLIGMKDGERESGRERDRVTELDLKHSRQQCSRAAKRVMTRLREKFKLESNCRSGEDSNLQQTEEATHRHPHTHNTLPPLLLSLSHSQTLTHAHKMKRMEDSGKTMHEKSPAM